MNRLLNKIRDSIYLLELSEIILLSLIVVLLGILSAKSWEDIGYLALGIPILLLMGWGFYLLVTYFWRSTPVWLVVLLGVLSGGIAFVLFIYLALLDANRFVLGKYLYDGAAPIEYFWNKESSEDLRYWKEEQKKAKQSTK